MGKAFTDISEGLKDAENHAQGKKSGVVEHSPEVLDVRAIRAKTRDESGAVLCHVRHFTWHASSSGTGVAHTAGGPQEFC